MVRSVLERLGPGGRPDPLNGSTQFARVHPVNPWGGKEMPPLRSARYARAIVAVLIVSAFALGSASSANAAPLACGDTLTSPGVYTLTANLNCSAMPPSTSALLIGGGVTINLNGYSIIGPGGTVPTFATIPTVGIETAGDTTIKNGIIRGFDIGILGAQTPSVK